MRRGTTPTITVSTSADLTDMTVYLALKQQGKQVIVKTGDDLTIEPIDGGGSTVKCSLTQEETLELKLGKVEVQFRATKDGGITAIASNIGTLEVGRILQDGVLE